MKYYLPVLVLLVVTFSCNLQTERRLNRYEQQLNPMVGVATKEDVVRQFGIPFQKDQVGQSEFWAYHFSYGTQTKTYTPNQQVRGTGPGAAISRGLNQLKPRAISNSRESFDDLLLEFDESGILKSWKHNGQ